EESNRRYSSLLDAIPDIIFIQKYDGEFLDYKAEEVSDLYISPDRIIGRNIKDIIPSHICKLFFEKVSIIQENKGVESFEYDLVINNVKRYFQARVSYRDENTVTTVIRDISELKTTQNELEDRKEFLESLITTMYEAVWMKDIDGRYTYYRWPAYENAGGNLNKYIGKTLDESHPKDEHSRLTNKMFNTAVASCKNVSYQTEVFVEPMDITMIVDVTLTPTFNDNDDVIGVVGVAKDITKQYKAEGKAQYFEKRYAEIVEAIEDVIFEIRKRRIVFVSPSIKQIIGVDSKEIIGMSIRDVIKHLSIRTPFNWIQRQKIFEMEMMDLKGKTRHFEVRYSSKGNMITGIAREITRRKNLEILKKNYRSGLIHELKNPLVLIQGYAEILKPKSSDKDAKMIDAILEAVAREDDRISSLTNRSASGWSYNFTLVNAYHLLTTRFEYLHRLFDSFVKKCHNRTDVVFKRNVSMELSNTWIMTDINSMTEVLENLISNAVKYSPPSRIEVEMTVTMDPSSEWIEIVVKDKGYGISEDYLRYIFKPFFRITDNEKLKGIQGMGMGLANVKLHVEANGGTVDVDSTEGQGSTFTVRLPVYQIDESKE
ncbi:MAG: ATP-binding protein, partial [Candidatus Thorarchaeota archaeon]